MEKPMPKVLPEYLELRRHQIIDAAAACFARTGFHQTTMQDICDEAGLSPGAVYRYFPSKEAIIQTMCTRGHEEDVTSIREAMADHSTIETFDNLIELYFSGTSNHELCVLSIELLSEARRDEYVLEAIRDGNSAIRQPLREIIQRAQASGEINPALDPDAVARVMMALYQGLVHQKVLEPDAPMEPFGEVIKALFRGDFWRGNSAGNHAPAGQGAALRH
jgi:AcrR family transcriptional regulator